ncbi:ComEC/Rec2 family competence protein [Candidatus Darwinibacter acetoxidans]
MDARRMRALFALLLAALVIFGAGALGSAEPENSVLLTLSVIDVGQRDSILISTSDGHAMLVDGGPADASGKVLEAIRKAGVERLDVLVSTHPHADHIGGLGGVLDAIPVGRVIDSGKVHTSKTYEGYLEKILAKDIPFALGRTGSSFALGPATIKILWPNEKLSDNLNDCSVVVRVIYGKFSALLAGDIEAGAEQTLVSRKLLSPAVVLKAAHHGSDTSSAAAFLNLSIPRYRRPIPRYRRLYNDEYRGLAGETLNLKNVLVY